MINVKEKIKQILEHGYLLSLGTSDKNGPWVADVRYVSDNNFNIYWMSETKYRHSKAIEKDQRVAGTIIINYKFGTPNLGVQISGIAKKNQQTGK